MYPTLPHHRQHQDRHFEKELAGRLLTSTVAQ